jgi:hypothetical protein
MTIANEVAFGPCCFCNEPIASSNTDPCRVTVSTTNDRWQVWYCHATCFRDRLFNREDGMFEPAMF